MYNKSFQGEGRNLSAERGKKEHNMRGEKKKTHNTKKINIT